MRTSWLLVTMVTMTCGPALLGGCRRASAEAARGTYAVVSNEDSNDVSVVDVARDEVAFTVPVGKRPRGMRIARDGKTLYVAVSGTPKGGGAGDDAADAIAVVDLARREVVRRIPSGHDPEAFDLTPDGAKMYVSNEDRAEVSVIDVASGRVIKTVKVGGEPEGVTVSPDGKLAYVASEASNEVYAIATDRDEVVGRVPTAARPRAIAFSPDGSRTLVSAENGGAVHLFDASRAEIARIPTAKEKARPMGIAFSPDGAHAFVANGREGSVAVIDVRKGALERSIPAVGARPWGLDVTRDGKKLYVAAGPDVAIVDVASGTVVKRVAAGKGPWGVVVAAPRDR
jgi:PQQ-dependent catabolism-associated beta-propeller protein